MDVEHAKCTEGNAETYLCDLCVNFFATFAWKIMLNNPERLKVYIKHAKCAEGNAEKVQVYLGNLCADSSAFFA